MWQKTAKKVICQTPSTVLLRSLFTYILLRDSVPKIESKQFDSFSSPFLYFSVRIFVNTQNICVWVFLALPCPWSTTERKICNLVTDFIRETFPLIWEEVCFWRAELLEQAAFCVLFFPRKTLAPGIVVEDKRKGCYCLGCLNHDGKIPPFHLNTKWNIWGHNNKSCAFCRH